MTSGEACKISLYPSIRTIKIFLIQSFEHKCSSSGTLAEEEQCAGIFLYQAPAKKIMHVPPDDDSHRQPITNSPWLNWFVWLYHGTGAQNWHQTSSWNKTTPTPILLILVTTCRKFQCYFCKQTGGQQSDCAPCQIAPMEKDIQPSPGRRSSWRWQFSGQARSCCR